MAKVGETVRCSTGPWTPAVHALLRYLERVGFDCAPRVLGVDVQGCEVLTYIPGDVPLGANPEVATDRALSEVGRLLHRYHEAVSEVKVGTICVHVLSNFRRFGTSPKIVTLPVARIALSCMPIG